ncbi:hypothetical protein A6V39_03960 [Candidatus Mycoplasma haematobovis]|uniref:Uncharacterized protein n=1 Tax=Candidatus Mycoplasma haematobovis TaxID=432608 RepID=A0A1A9QC60_9MOLU|nr:hypothetical protein [Candidatus Mycoplasma haematobovis]OAL10043.1 hypothetical protein A6V39_03960 [Candidatus Mycoplasma haematobovis]
MLSVKAKVGICIVSAISLGGLGYGIHALIFTDSLENYLSKYELSLIEDSAIDEWKQIFESYKLEKEGYEIDRGVKDENAIKGWCKSSLKKNIKSTYDPLFQKATRWCIEITTIEEKLKDSGEFEEETTKLTGKYIGLNPKVRQLVDKEVVTDTSENANGSKIKQWCDTNKKRRFVPENKKDFFLENIKKVCLKSE